MILVRGNQKEGKQETENKTKVLIHTSDKSEHKINKEIVNKEELLSTPENKQTFQNKNTDKKTEENQQEYRHQDTVKSSESEFIHTCIGPKRNEAENKTFCKACISIKLVLIQHLIIKQKNSLNIFDDIKQPEIKDIKFHYNTSLD